MLLFVLIFVYDFIEFLLNHLVALRDFFLQILISFKFLFEGKEVIFASIALQGRRYLFLAFATVAVAEFGEFLGIGFSGTDGSDNGKPCKSANISDHHIETQVEQTQVFLHFFGGRGCRMEKVGSVAAVGSEFFGIALRQETAAQKPQAVQFLNPLTVFYICFFAFDVFGEFAIAKNDLKALGIKHGIETLPIDAGAFQRHRLDFLRFEPISHRKKVAAEDPKLFDVFFALSHSHPMRATSYVNTRSLGIDHFHLDFSCASINLVFELEHRLNCSQKMCFWQSKYSERGYLQRDTATEIIANISTGIAQVL